MPIQRLSDVVAAQIAAGEVVERPASVVKELIENALDAGAHTIQIEASEGGRRLLRVSDDGGGIPAAEAELAFARHATSKLYDIDDLNHLQTLGFRGEALASIASVAYVTLRTRVAEEQTGTLLRIQGGQVVERKATGSQPGTSITIESLFYNTPARLKFLKAETTERRHIDMLVMRYAMAYANVRFTLTQDERPVFRTTGNGDLRDVLVEVLGLETVRALIEVAPRPGLPIQVYGYASAPSLQKNARNQISLFVNGRYIQDNALIHAVAQAYHTLMPADRYPVAVLLITLPPEEVDVNVHPTKAEVRFQAPDAVFSAVQSSVRRALIAHNQHNSTVPELGNQAFGGHPDVTGAAGNGESSAYSNNGTSPGGFDSLPGQSAPLTLQPLTLDLHTPDPGYRTQQQPTGMAVPPAWTTAPSASTPPRSNVPSLPPLRVVGQVAATYIIAEGPAGMYLVDQHAAHERILYEQFMADLETQQPIAQRTLNAVTIEVTSEAASALIDNADALHAIGFEMEAFGDRMFRVHAVPALLADRDPGEAVARILDDLANGTEPGASGTENKLILHVCKGAAVKAGQTLSYAEMQGLIQQLSRCVAPRACPHGRPTLIHLSREQLEKEFGRR